jgi:hypothetical protein
VPTLIFIDKEGNTTDRLESEIGKDDIEKCVKKILSDEVKQ